MISKIPKNTHRQYISEDSNKKVPSVTELLNVVAKPYLVPWANRMGLQGVDINQYNAEITGIGTMVHGKIEAYYQGMEFDVSGYPSEMKEKADELFIKFLTWENEHDVKIIYNELPMISEKFGGTIDAVMELDGKLTVIDWKTSKEIYPEYFGQLTAYYYLMNRGKPMNDADPSEVRDIGSKIEQVGIVHIPKENSVASMKIVPVRSELFKIGWEFFSSCLKLYNSNRILQTYNYKEE